MGMIDTGMNRTWQHEWRRMQLWLFSGYLCLVLAALLAWIATRFGFVQPAIVIGVLGGVLCITLVGVGVMSYINVMRIRAREAKSPGRSNQEWLLAFAFLVIPLTLYTLWYFRFR